MASRRVLHLSIALLLAASGAGALAQIPLPGAPQQAFGASISPAFEGWFTNPDGTHSFLIGYYNRNTELEVDVPVGDDNYFEPGEADRGQPTHFLPRRQYGVFVVTVPEDFPPTEKIYWVLSVNNETFRIPFYMHVNYEISPFSSSEESPNGLFNTPPTIKFDEAGPTFKGPVGSVASAVSRTARARTPMPFDFWADDDGLYSSGTNRELREGPPPVSLQITKYRGPGDILIGDKPTFEALKGGRPAEPYSGKGSTAITFSEPGDYLLHIRANDYSGNGGGGSGCCWTTAIARVAVSAQASGQ